MVLPHDPLGLLLGVKTLGNSIIEELERLALLGVVGRLGETKTKIRGSVAQCHGG